MKSKALLAAALMLAMALTFVIPAGESDGTVSSITVEGGDVIKMDRDKTVEIVLDYVADRNDTCVINVYDRSNPSIPLIEPISQTFEVTDEGKIVIPFNYNKSGAGSIQLKITFSNDVYKDVYLTVEYNTSIWGNWTTYGVIIVIIILIAALVIYKSRSAPKEKNQLTFEEIEAQKKAERTAAPKEKAPAAAKTERQRYLDSKKKN